MISPAIDHVSWAKSKATMLSRMGPDAVERIRTSGAIWEEAVAVFGETGAIRALGCLRLFRRTGISGAPTPRAVSAATC